MQEPHQQKLLLLLLFTAFTPSYLYPLTISNPTESKIRYNIFKKKNFFNPFARKWGKLSQYESREIKGLDSKDEYQVIFYDPYNALHNQKINIKGNIKKLSYTMPKNKSAVSIAEIHSSLAV